MEDKLRKIVIALGILAAILLGVLIYVWSTKSSLVKDLNQEKIQLTEEMRSLQGEYNELQTNNDSLTVQIDREKEKVDQLIERIQKTEATNRAQIKQYEKELGTLRSIMKHYIVQIDSLNTLNTTLRQDAVAARREAAENRRQYEELSRTTDNLSKQVAQGSVVKGREVTLVAINSSGKETDRSSRTEKFRACVNLVENAIAKSGYRTIYIRVKGPDGILLTDDRQRLFTCDGEQMIYSASREVDYQGEEIEICIFFSAFPAGEYSKGVYTVDVYSTEQKLGSADCLLR